ncbi:MAG TPA: formylglycine-generating enzyme family protein [Gemmata sp.]|jgi:formylglycine-generating enzyme required for sulfatase activity|nr:formylglycine-generating enzyme family protein [Gemmata sp.]
MSRLVCGIAFPILLTLAITVGYVTNGIRSVEASRERVDPEKDPKAGEVRKFEIAPNVFMDFCYIPAGEGQLGSPKAEQDYITKEFHDGVRPDYLDDETEEKRGKFKMHEFWLGKYPVTQEEWKIVMGGNPSLFQPDGKGKDKLQKDKISETSRFPVEQVSWSDCQKFVEMVNTRGGVVKVFGKAGQFALPHEDEWEYACRGGKGNKQAFYFGNELNGSQANCDGNFPYGMDKKGTYKERTTEVGSYAKDWPHPWGLCDMHGNVWQWCENRYERSMTGRVVHGGSWISRAKSCRIANRSGISPDDYFNDLGFRVCFRLD